MTVILMTGLLLGLAAPVMAQVGGGAGGIGGAIDGIVTAITDIIQTVCVGLGILGLSIWGIGKIARPVFPQISGLTQNYMGDLMIGIAVVFVASQIVEGLASAMGGA
jgi:hypothetical protein